MNTRIHARCPIRTTFDLVGGKWRLLLLAQLSRSEMRYSELSQAVPELSEKVLAQELRHLQDNHLVIAEQSGRTKRYRLTDAGWAALPLIDAMSTFAHAYENRAYPDTVLDSFDVPKS